MATYQQTLLIPGDAAGPTGSGRSLSAAQLAKFCENTLAMLRAGYRVPVLARHAPPAAVYGGPQSDARRDGDRAAARAPGEIFSRVPWASRRVGWLIDLVQTGDGSLLQTLEIDDEAGSARTCRSVHFQFSGIATALRYSRRSPVWSGDHPHRVDGASPVQWPVAADATSVVAHSLLR